MTPHERLAQIVKEIGGKGTHDVWVCRECGIEYAGDEGRPDCDCDTIGPKIAVRPRPILELNALLEVWLRKNHGAWQRALTWTTETKVECQIFLIRIGSMTSVSASGPNEQTARMNANIAAYNKVKEE